MDTLSLFTYERGVKIGKSNFDLLKFCKTLPLTDRVNSVSEVVAHPNFIYRDNPRSRTIAWNLLKRSRKTEIDRPYKIEGSCLWICSSEFKWEPYRGLNQQ